jgi:hypothetical protein
MDTRYVGARPLPDVPRNYGPVSPLPQNAWAYGGSWQVGGEHAVAGSGAEIELHFHASKVYLVMGGEGRVRVAVAGRQLRVLRVRGISRLYTVVDAPHLLDAQLRLTFTPGVRVYSFTFG